MELIKPLIEQVRKNHPNLTTMDAIKFLKIIEYSRSDLGVCHYAIFVNAILEANHIDIAMLEEKLGYKLREANLKKIPLVIILGDKEKENGNISYRKHGSTETVTISIDDFVVLLNNEIKKYR